MTVESERFASEEQRVVKEILGDVEFWALSEKGPNGPWMFRTLKVRREENTIIVRDVDGELADRFRVHELEPSDEQSTTYEHALRGRLETLNDETLDEL